MIIELQNIKINDIPLKVVRKQGNYTHEELKYWGKVISRNKPHSGIIRFNSYKIVSNWCDWYVEVEL